MLKFYEQIANSFGMTVNEDKLYVGNMVKTINGLPLVMPTKDIVANMTVLKEGKYVQTVELFHPLKDVIDRNNPALTELRRSSGIMLNNYAYNLMMLLLKVVHDKPTDLSLSLIEFLSTIKVSKQVKVIVDDPLMDFLNTNKSRFLTGDLTFMKTHVPRGTVIKGGKVNRALTLEFPLKTALSDTAAFKRENRLGSKHVAVLSAIADYLFAPWLEDNIVTFSNHTSKAGPYVILEGYKMMTEHFNKLAEEFMDLDGERVKELHTKIYYKLSDLDELIDIDFYLPEVGVVQNDQMVNELLVETAPWETRDEAIKANSSGGNEEISAEEYLKQNAVRRTLPPAATYVQPGVVPQQLDIYGNPLPQYNQPVAGTYLQPTPLQNAYAQGGAQQNAYGQGAVQQPVYPQGGTVYTSPTSYAQPNVTYLQQLLTDGDLMAPQDRDALYNALAPQEQDQYHRVMQNRQANSRMGQPDRR